MSQTSITSQLFVPLSISYKNFLLNSHLPKTAIRAAHIPDDISGDEVTYNRALRNVVTPTRLFTLSLLPNKQSNIHINQYCGSFNSVLSLLTLQILVFEISTYTDKVKNSDWYKSCYLWDRVISVSQLSALHSQKRLKRKFSLFWSADCACEHTRLD
jgi:hypothetical protein